jgi:hypothetical protein
VVDVRRHAPIDGPLATLQFKGLYDLSSPQTRYCRGAKFVEVSLIRGGDGYVYIWGVEGGRDYAHSAPYIARVKTTQIANQADVTYFHGVRRDDAPIFTAHGGLRAKALFHNQPDCMA